jgi:hypothetical protein
MRALILAVLGIVMLAQPAAAHCWIRCHGGSIQFFTSDADVAPNEFSNWQSPVSNMPCSNEGRIAQLYEIFSPINPTGSRGALEMISSLQHAQSLQSRIVKPPKIATAQNHEKVGTIEIIRVNPNSFAPDVRKVLFPKN